MRRSLDSLPTVLMVDLRAVPGGPREREQVAAAVVRALRRATAAAGGEMLSDERDLATAHFDLPDHAVVAAIDTFRHPDVPDPLSMACAVHAETPTRDRGRGVSGATVQRAAAILHATPSGQIVVSGGAATALSPPEDAWLEPLGLHRLRDLSEPVELFRVFHAQLPTPRDAPDTLDPIAHDLPIPPTSFVGRGDIIDELVERLAASRLLTITGPGGAGKTRLAMQTAATVAGRPFQEVRFVSLADITDPGRVGPTVAGALGAPSEPGLAPVDRVAHHFMQRQVLLVLDNCEHVLGAAATFTSALLARCHRLRMLATSRQPLTVPGEVVWNLVGLPIPSEIDTTSEEQLRRSEPVELFLDRAAAADAQFQTDSVEAIRTVARICERLDGLPLAIELAAARVRALSLDDIEGQLEDRFALLTEGPRTAPRRQRGLQQAIGWSYDLLDPDQQLLFDRLGVFHGPVEADAVARVCGGERQEPAVVQGQLADLVERSLVVAERDGGRTTYRQLETLRSYGRRRLALRDEAGVRDAHLRWVVGFCLDAGERLEGPEQPEWITRITARLEDIRAAVAHVIETSEVREALVAITAIYIYWYVRDCRTGVELLARLREHLDLAELPAATEADVRFATGALRERLGETRVAAEDIARAVERYESAGDRRGLSNGLVALARARWGDADADELRGLLQRALTIAEELGDEPTGEGHALLFLMIVADEEGDDDAVVDLARRCREPLEQSSPDLRAHGLEIAGYGEARAGCHDDARPLLVEAIETYERNRALSCGAHALLSTARCLQLTGRDEQAARLLGASDGFRRQIDLPTPRYERFLLDPLREELRAALDQATLDALHAEGRALGFDDAMAYARRLLADETPPAGGDAQARRLYRLLGSVGATVDGTEVDVGSAKQRRVLARLLAAEGDLVSVDQLVEAVWGQDAPAKPRASLQSYISRLRRALRYADHDDDPLVSTGDSYAVDLTDADLDLHLAERTVTDVRRGEDPAVVADHSAQALEYWRGRVGAAHDRPTGSPRQPHRAAEVRRQLVVHRARALESLGREAEAVAELQPIAADYPYDGELIAVLLRALASQGRQGDALAHYARFRSRLADDLGADPSPELQAFHLALLDHLPPAPEQPG